MQINQHKALTEAYNNKRQKKAKIIHKLRLKWFLNTIINKKKTKYKQSSR